jgi:hypothetical protein
MIRLVAGCVRETQIAAPIVVVIAVDVMDRERSDVRRRPIGVSDSDSVRLRVERFFAEGAAESAKEKV